VALKAREVQVPDLTNRTANEATSLAADLGLAVRLDDTRRPDPKIPTGRVLAQDPPPGTMTREQRSVRVWLSTGPRASTVPALTGETERSAQMRLSQDGLEEATLSEIRSASFPSDVVVAQAGLAGGRQLLGDVVGRVLQHVDGLRGQRIEAM